MGLTSPGTARPWSSSLWTININPSVLLARVENLNRSPWTHHLHLNASFVGRSIPIYLPKQNHTKSLCFSVLHVWPIEPKLSLRNWMFIDKITKMKAILFGILSCLISANLYNCFIIFPWVGSNKSFESMGNLFASPHLLWTKQFFQRGTWGILFLLGVRSNFVQAWNYLKTFHQKPWPSDQSHTWQNTPFLRRPLSCCVGFLKGGLDGVRYQSLFPER